MSRLLFVQTLWMEQLGVMSLAAAAKANGHTVALALGDVQRIVETARKFRPDVVGFTVLTGYQKKYLRIARSIKQAVNPAPIVIFGGPHPTFFPEVILEDGVDIGCRGEGEGAIIDVLRAVSAGENNFAKIPNLIVKSEGALKIAPMRPLENLDALPHPDREMSFQFPFIRKDPNRHFMAGRGCPYDCSFCFNRRMRALCDGLGDNVRLRSPVNVVDEIESVNKKWGIEVVYFQDDTFILNRKWLFEFLDIYPRRLRLPFYCTVRADLVTREIAKALKDAGCYRVSFGVESGVESLRNEILGKGITDDHIRRTAAILRESGIAFQTTNMMGLPGEKLADALKTLELNIEIGADVAWTSLYQPYPGTELGEKALADGKVERLPDDESIADAHTSSLLDQPEIDEVQRLQKFSYLAVKFPSLLPTILKAVKRDREKLYYYVHRITYLLFYFKRITKMSWPRAIHEAYVAWKYYR